MDEWLAATPQGTRDLLASFQATVIKELLRRAETYVTSRGLEPHVYRSLGNVPTVLFRAYESGGKPCHGNFHEDSFAAIARKLVWASRIEKAHSGKKRGWFRNAAR